MDLSKFQDDAILAEWMLSKTEQGRTRQPLHGNWRLEPRQRNSR